MPFSRLRRRRKQERFAALETFRLVRRAADEDVTRFGDELRQLDSETLATPLDETMRGDYWQALEAYESAKAALAAATVPADVTAVTRSLAAGRFAHACVLAARDGSPRPVREDPCFFDPAHGPAVRDVEWAPLGGVPRAVPVCFYDHERLEAGEHPAARTVQLGDRRVPWYASGPTYTSWAQGWYAGMVREQRVEAAQLTTMYAAAASGGVAAGALGVTTAWVDPGAWDGGGTIGGQDYSGYGGDFGGGFDGGGFDGGGFDGGGGV